jgi:hypothetical protein
VETLAGVLRDLGLYAVVALTFLGPIEAFLRFRLWQATHRGEPHAYLALADPWVALVVALAGAGAAALAGALS